MICIENKDFVLDEHTVVTLGKFDGIHKENSFIKRWRFPARRE